MSALGLKRSEFQSLVNVARNNWRDWQDVFEHKGSISNNVLLFCPNRFERFCNEYSVRRTIRKTKRDEFRQALQKSAQFQRALKDGSGKTLVRLESKMRKRFGTRKGKNGMVSIFSKVAAFARPDRFVAWDRYARKGVKIILRGKFDTYSEYLAQVDEIWNGEVGSDIRMRLKRVRPRIASLDNNIRFQRRVLDVYLMLRGGRELLPACSCCPIPEVRSI